MTEHVKRMRVFAGPNGSGKTNLTRELQKKVRLGIYVNADDIEQTLLEKRQLDFSTFNLEFTTSEVHHYFAESTLSAYAHRETDFSNNTKVENNHLHISEAVHTDSYFAADIAGLIRRKLLRSGLSFSYETVMSHSGKIDFMKQATESGYRVYLYFIATEDPQINITRVNFRVAQNGHRVSPDKIRSRYVKSLENLKAAVKHSSRAYIFDNTQIANVLIAEVSDGSDIKIIDPEKAPGWFIKYLVE